MNGAGSLTMAGESLLIGEPDTGWLVSRYSVEGALEQSFGHLRATGHERDPDVHIALNTGFPLPAADGGVWFVFQAGVPLLRKYDAAGALQFERHIEGVTREGRLLVTPGGYEFDVAGRDGATG